MGVFDAAQMSLGQEVLTQTLEKKSIHCSNRNKKCYEAPVLKNEDLQRALAFSSGECEKFGAFNHFQIRCVTGKRSFEKKKTNNSREGKNIL